MAIISRFGTNRHSILATSKPTVRIFSIFSLESPQIRIFHYSTSFLLDYQVSNKFSYCRIHIIQKLGDLPLHELKASHIRSLIDGCNGAQAKSSHIRTCLHTALESALEEELIDSNPCSKVRMPLRYTPRFEPLSQQEMEILITAKHIPNYAQVITAMTTGMRQGELLALRWRNVDLDKGALYTSTRV